MSSPWRHSICQDCWNKRHPDRTAVAIVDDFRSQEKCCFCSKVHKSGIYVRENPADMECNGVHP